METEPFASFERHPGLRGRAAPEARAKAEELRSLVGLSVTTAPSVETVAAQEIATDQP